MESAEGMRPRGFCFSPAAFARALRRSMAALLLFLAFQSAFSAQAVAQEKFLNAGELPMMSLRVCRSFEAAKRQADISKSRGLLSIENAIASPLKENDCGMVMVRARLLSIEAIPSYIGWATTFDKEGPRTTIAEVYGQSYVVKYSAQLQRFRVFKAALTDNEGNYLEAWVEIPERPYMVSFLEDNKKRSEK